MDAILQADAAPARETPADVLAFVTLVNDTELFAVSRATLCDGEPDAPVWHAVDCAAQGYNAAQGLNAGLDASDAAWVVLAHQDIVYPTGWLARLRVLLAALDNDVAVAGLVGVTRGGAFRGHVLDPHGHQRWGPLPTAAGDDVCSLDEHVLVLRRDAGVRFDAATPGFHCYGTDVVLQARASGMRAVVLDCPVIHLSAGTIDARYHEAGDWLLGKWGGAMGGVIPTAARTLAERRAGTLVRRLRVKLARDRSHRGRRDVVSVMDAAWPWIDGWAS